MVILVTGASGQLGQALQFVAPSYPGLVMHFADSAQADVTDKQSLEAIISRLNPDFCINAAAYTAVDKAESEKEKAIAINTLGAKNLAEVCKIHDVTLVHISTDFVFDGSKKEPYKEEDQTNPQGVYGLTKRDGEREIQAVLEKQYIIRTSWLYSQFGQNFMKTMLRLASERPSLGVVNDQTGTPTHAVDLAKAILDIIQSGIKAYGIYHYSNEGETTWYGFAKAIFELNNIDIQVNPIPTSAYPTPAQRPEYSVLDKSKIRKIFGMAIPNWQDTLRNHK